MLGTGPADVARSAQLGSYDHEPLTPMGSRREKVPRTQFRLYPAAKRYTHLCAFLTIRAKESKMLDPEDVAATVVLACTQSAHSRIIEIQMRTMDELLA